MIENFNHYIIDRNYDSYNILNIVFVIHISIYKNAHPNQQSQNENISLNYLKKYLNIISYKLNIGIKCTFSLN